MSMFDDSTFDSSDSDETTAKEGCDLDYDLYDFLAENACVETGFVVEKSDGDLHYNEFVIFLDEPTHDNCYFLGLNVGSGYFFWAHIIGSVESLQEFLPKLFYIGRGLINEASLMEPKRSEPILTTQSKYSYQTRRYDC